MPLILAIEPDRRQAAQLTAVVRKRVSAELILVDTTERALDALGNRMPDLVLVPALLSPQDDAALAGALRVIAAAAHVQMLTIPVLGAAGLAPRSGGMLSSLRRGKSRVVQSDGCDPGVFAEQIASYLERAAQERASGGMDLMPDDSASEAAAPPEVVEVAAVSEEAALPEVVEVAAVSEEAALPEVAEVAAVAEAAAPPELAQVTAVAEAAAPPEVAEEAAVVDFMARAEEINDAVVEPMSEDVRGGLAPEWVDAPVEIEEPPMAAAADESVSIALEEAVRALFADEAPAAGQPAEPPLPPVAQALSAPTINEWTAVEELMAALEAIPLAAIEAFEYDERLPVLKALDGIVDQPERVIEDPDGDDIGPTAELGDEDGQPVPVAARSEREWVALIESLRHDVERLRVERAEKPLQKPPQPQPRPVKTGEEQKPAQDEWGFFDPEQCGFAALLAKLDEVTEAEEGRI